jgi:hypothetical protein
MQHKKVNAKLKIEMKIIYARTPSGLVNEEALWQRFSKCFSTGLPNP